MNEWGARSFQAVWFLAGPPARIPADEIYRRTFELEPETHFSNPGQSIATGNTLTGEYRIQGQPGRIDLFLLPSASTAAVGGPPILILLPHIDAAMEEFSSKLESACSAVGEAYRIALVVTLSAQVETREQATASVLRAIGLSLPFTDGSDLVFQVNRQRALEDNKYTINRLLQWRTETVQQLTALAGSASNIMENIYATTFAADINNVPAPQRILSPTDQLWIFREMSAEARRCYSERSIKGLI